MTTTQTVLSHWIHGREETSRSGRDAGVTNSATGEVVTRVPFADAEEVDAAVQAAVAAAPAWESASLSERTRIMFAFRELLHERREEMARLVTLEHGKVTADALGEVQRELELVEFACGLSAAAQGRALLAGLTRRRQLHAAPAGRRGGRHHAVQLPLDGAGAGCSRWPSRPATRSCSSRPSRIPSASMMLAELLAEAGLPDGVFNVVHGDREAVDALLDASARERGLVRRLDARGQAHLRDGDRPRQARAGARRGQEPRGRAARRRPRLHRRRSSWPGRTARAGSDAWRCPLWSPSATRAMRSSRRSPNGSVGSWWARATSPSPRWGP